MSIENTLINLSKQNTAQSQAMADKTNQFNAQEAQKNRDFQKEMSSTAHQREVKDLLNAGLNPVLSANGGAGATTPTGSAAQGTKGDVDSSAVHALAAVAGSSMQANAMLANAQLQAQVAREQMGVSKYIAELNAETERLGIEAGKGNNENTNTTSKENTKDKIIGSIINTAVNSAPWILTALLNYKGNASKSIMTGKWTEILPSYLRNTHFNITYKDLSAYVKRFGVPGLAIAGSATALGSAFNYRMKHFDEITKKTAKRRR